MTKWDPDLTVVNAPRVSFGKNKEVFEASDEKLISFLARHNPVTHCSVQFRIKILVFVARQLVKHQVGLSWNEISRRYVDYEPEYYDPDIWRLRAEDKKQGSTKKQSNLEWIDRDTRTGNCYMNWQIKITKEC